MAQEAVFFAPAAAAAAVTVPASGADAPVVAWAEAAPPKVARHNGTDGVGLVERVRAALASARIAAHGFPPAVLVELTCHCEEAEPLEISSGEVTLRGSVEGAGKARLALPGVRVTSGGALCLSNLELYCSEENRVQGGLLRCSDCFITSRNGCGVLCLQRARVFLRDCEVTRCMRSGIGVNGKNTEIDLQGCVVSQNNFSGIGVNHQARSITLKGNRIIDNGYHGIWLNAGVVAQWLGGEISGNRLSDKDGPGSLRGFAAGTGTKAQA